MPLTSFPTPPSRTNRSTFATLADAFLGHFPTFVAEINLLETNVEAAEAAAVAAELAAETAQAAAELARDEAEDAQAAAEAAAVTAINAPGTRATSTDSRTIGTGSKTFAIQTGKEFAVGMYALAADAADPTRWMLGPVTAHNSGTGSLTINVTHTNGSGTLADWRISLSAPVRTSTPWSEITGEPTTNSGYGITDTGLILVSSHSPSGVATLDITTGIDNSADEYELHILNLVTDTTGGPRVWLRITEDGSTWLATSYVNQQTRVVGGVTTLESAEVTAFMISGGVEDNPGSAGFSGVIRFSNHAQTTNRRVFSWHGGYQSTSGTPGVVSGFGLKSVVAAAMVGVRIMFDTGNIASGKVKLYKVKKDLT